MHHAPLLPIPFLPFLSFHNLSSLLSFFYVALCQAGCELLNNGLPRGSPLYNRLASVCLDSYGSKGGEEEDTAYYYNYAFDGQEFGSFGGVQRFTTIIGGGGGGEGPLVYGMLPRVMRITPRPIGNMLARNVLSRAKYEQMRQKMQAGVGGMRRMGPNPNGRDGMGGMGGMGGAGPQTRAPLDQCEPCESGFQARLRVRQPPNTEAAGATPATPFKCGVCVDAMQMRVRFPEQTLETFDAQAFHLAVSDALVVNPRRVLIQAVEEGSVIVTLKIMPKILPPLPSNTTQGEGEGEGEGERVGEGEGGGEGEGTGGLPYRAAESEEGEGRILEANATSATSAGPSDTPPAAAGEGEGAGGVPAGPRLVYAPEMLARLETLLSSHDLPGYGRFSYWIETGEDMCGRFAQTKAQVKQEIAYQSCAANEGLLGGLGGGLGGGEEGLGSMVGMGRACDIIWGDEIQVPNYREKMDGNASLALRTAEGEDGVARIRGFPDGAEGVTDLLYDSMFESISNDTMIITALQHERRGEYMQSIALALDNIGQRVRVPLSDDLVMVMEGGLANYSSKNCTGCACESDLPSASQPFLEWSIKKLSEIDVGV